ncbi:hypothetical protein CYMTET_38437 [Cymbomonas tetramitiformis]|uniref:Uncharacterized protein n=1 Tax=Cymbomonas tetramitiformis TaxID=36881 RepID=A0AAE0CDS0_9CHLO|nr:hypothetical protein CYMTET_38437 [Cymbomonas tetramitiformis]
MLAASQLGFIHVVGVPVGRPEAVESKLLELVEDLCGLLGLLGMLHDSQAQGLLSQYWAHPRVGYCLRGGPPEPMVQHSPDFAALSSGMGLASVAQATNYVASLSNVQQHWQCLPARYPLLRRYPAFETPPVEFQVALRFLLHAEQPTLVGIRICPDHGAGRVDPEG